MAPLAGVYCERSNNGTADPLSSDALTYVVLPTQNGVIHIGTIIPQAMLPAELHLWISALFAWGRSQ
jgi:hypothetical protein